MQIDIVLHEWKVKLKDELELDKQEVGTLGCALFPSREIWILNTLKNDELEQVARHETVHALLYEFGCYCLGNYNDEFVCDFVANNMKMIEKISNKIIDYVNNMK